MDKKFVQRKVRLIIDEYHTAMHVTLKSTMDDLGLDSLDMTEIILHLEDEFEIVVEMHELVECENVGSICDLVYAKITQNDE